MMASALFRQEEEECGVAKLCDDIADLALSPTTPRLRPERTWHLITLRTSAQLLQAAEYPAKTHREWKRRREREREREEEQVN